MDYGCAQGFSVLFISSCAKFGGQIVGYELWKGILRSRVVGNVKESLASYEFISVSSTIYLEEGMSITGNESFPVLLRFNKGSF